MCPVIRTPFILVKWESSICIYLDNPQVVPVLAANLLACRLNVSGSSMCATVEMNQI